jgi:hypothetical protein
MPASTHGPDPQRVPWACYIIVALRRLSGLLPHPAELVLKTVEEVEATGAEGEEGHGELS